MFVESVDRALSINYINSQLGNVRVFYKYSNLSNTDFTDATAFPVRSHWFISRLSSKQIFYNIYHNTPNRTVVFEFNAFDHEDKSHYCHFQLLFFEDKPNIVQFIYLNISDAGSSNSAAVQGKTQYQSLNSSHRIFIYLLFRFDIWSIYAVFF
jgi:hypothetical protein